MKTNVMTISGLVGVLALSVVGCAKVSVEGGDKPIHMVLDVNIRVDQELDRFFAYESEPATRAVTPPVQPVSVPATATNYMGYGMNVTAVTLNEDEGGTQSLRDRFKARYPQLRQLKSEGKLGETFAGFIDAPGELDDAAKAVMESENADRKELYAAIAEKEKTSPDVVAKRNAQRNFQRAKPGDYLKGEDGNWTQK